MSEESVGRDHLPVVSGHMTTWLRPAAVLLVLAVLSLIPTPTGAAPTRQSVAEQVDRLASEISEVDEQYNLARIELQKVQSQIRDAERRKAEADATLTGLKTKASAQSVAVYRAGVPKMLHVLFSSTSISDFQRRMSLVTRVADWEDRLIESLELAQARADEVREELQTKLGKRQSIERSLASKRSALEKRIAEQRALLARMDAPKRSAIAPKNLPALPVSGKARIAVETGYSLLGKPYRYAGSGPDSFDCSGFTSYVWGKAGVYLPHSSRAQYGATPRVDRSQLQPGDLVFYYRPIHHVAMYIGGGRIIHASTHGDPVKIDSIDYNRYYVGAGRPGV